MPQCLPMVKWWLPAQAETRAVVEAMLEFDSAAREVALAYLPPLCSPEVDDSAKETLDELGSAVAALQRAASKLETAAYRAEDADPDDPALPRWPHVRPKLIRVLERAEARLEAAIDAYRDLMAEARARAGRWPNPDVEAMRRAEVRLRTVIDALEQESGKRILEPETSKDRRAVKALIDAYAQAKSRVQVRQELDVSHYTDSPFDIDAYEFKAKADANRRAKGLFYRLARQSDPLG